MINHICHDLFFCNLEASKYLKQNIFWVLINRNKITNGLYKEFCELWLQICFISQLDHLPKIIVKYCYKWRQLKKKSQEYLSCPLVYLPLNFGSLENWVSRLFLSIYFLFYFYIYFHRLQCDIIWCNISEIWKTHPKFLLLSLPVIKLTLSENY